MILLGDVTHNKRIPLNIVYLGGVNPTFTGATIFRGLRKSIS